MGPRGKGGHRSLPVPDRARKAYGQPAIGVKVHAPVAASQASLVQALLSSHAPLPAEQLPPEQLSPLVQ
jgi:hypothetical protein